jgi:hypothetical protein
MTQENSENPTKKEYWEIKPDDRKRRKSYKVGRKRAVKILRNYMNLMIDNPKTAKEYLTNQTKLSNDRNTKRFFYWLVQDLNWLVIWLAENYDNEWNDWEERMKETIHVILGD